MAEIASELVKPALPTVGMELNRGQGRGGGAESRDKGTKEEIQMMGSNWEEREENLEDRHVRKERDEVGIGKGHHQGRREGKGRGRTEREGEREKGEVSMPGFPLHLKKRLLVWLVKQGAHFLVPVSAPSATGLCKEGRLSIPWHPLEPIGEWER